MNGEVAAGCAPAQAVQGKRHGRCNRGRLKLSWSPRRWANRRCRRCRHPGCRQALQQIPQLLLRAVLVEEGPRVAAEQLLPQACRVAAAGALNLLPGGKERGDGVDGGGCHICKLHLQPLPRFAAREQGVAPKGHGSAPGARLQGGLTHSRKGWQAAKAVNKAAESGGEGGSLKGVEAPTLAGEGGQVGVGSPKQLGRRCLQSPV